MYKSFSSTLINCLHLSFVLSFVVFRAINLYIFLHMFFFRSSVWLPLSVFLSIVVCLFLPLLSFLSILYKFLTVFYILLLSIYFMNIPSPFCVFMCLLHMLLLQPCLVSLWLKSEQEIRSNLKPGYSSTVSLTLCVPCIILQCVNGQRDAQFLW